MTNVFDMQQSGKYLELLDDSQREAVKYIDGPSLVIAGAGAGKTRVLTTKIAYLIDNGINPWNILALTFTNKAAREMRDRVAGIVGEDSAKRLQMGTFHSVFARILRTEAGAIGYSPRFTIYDRSDSGSLLKQIVKEWGLDDKKYKANAVLSRISWAKNHLILPEAYANNTELLKSDSAENIPAVRDIYVRYQQRLKASEAMDFDDLLVQMFFLLNNRDDVRLKYSERYDFVLVDEYQDTNFTQAKILALLTKEHKRICVVGDDAQSIYAFRGADIDNILNFTKTLPAAKLFKLERNYRSTRCIVDAANSVISNNKRRIPKHVYSLAGQGDSILIKEAYSDLEEADFVMKKVCELTAKEHLNYNDIAVLYRTNSQSRVIEESLRKNSIPYKIVGGLSFYERKEIKDVIAYFRFIVNPDDEEAFRRIINYPARGIGSTTLARITAVAMGKGISMWRAVNDLSAEELGVSGFTMKKILAFATMMNGFINAADKTDAYSLVLRVIDESGIRKEITSDMSIENISRRENLEELLSAVNTFVENTLEGEGNVKYATIDRYLSEVALLTDADVDTDDTEHVTLMTIHSAKGLEYDAVLIVGLEEEIFPGQSASCSTRNLEEERRLFYVALTRAKRFCFLSYARSRFRYGQMSFSEPSRFIDEIDKSCVRISGNVRTKKDSYRTNFLGRHNYAADSDIFSSSGYGGKPVFKKMVLNGFDTERKGRVIKMPSDSATNEENGVLSSAVTRSGALVKVGQTVEHERFGRGVVKSLTDAGDTVKARIVFDNSGEKDLLLKFAQIRVLD